MSATLRNGGKRALLRMCLVASFFSWLDTWGISEVYLRYTRNECLCNGPSSRKHLPRFLAALGFASLSARCCAEFSWCLPSWRGFMAHFGELEQYCTWTLAMVTQPSCPLRWSWCGIFGSQVCGSLSSRVGRASAVRCCLPWEPRSAYGPWDTKTWAVYAPTTL